MCEAKTGTAYEYDRAVGHWQTKVFPVNIRYRLTRRDGLWLAILAGSPATEPLECLPDPGPAARLACGPRGQLWFDLVNGIFSAPLSGAEAATGQIARTAVGSCARE